MTRLLVSVRDADEARRALAGGADLLDVKEPDRGPLGRADARSIAAVLEAASGRAAVSAALGELVDLPAAALDLPAGLALVKLGLSCCAALPDWRRRWRLASESWALHPVAAPSVHCLPAAEPPRPVAVVYADGAAVGAPSAEQVLAAAVELRCGAALVDTFDKSRGGLLCWWSDAELRWFVRRARRAGMLAVVAGGLSVDDLPRVLRQRPDVVAVRGAACAGGRRGAVDVARVERLARALAAARTARRVLLGRRV